MGRLDKKTLDDLEKALKRASDGINRARLMLKEGKNMFAADALSEAKILLGNAVLGLDKELK